MESRTLAGAKKSLGTAIKVADSRREIENGKEYPIYLSILGTGKNEGSFQSFQGSVSFQDGVGRVSSNLYKQLGMGASLKVNGDSIELSGKDTDGFSVVANADGISILGRDKEEEELDQDPAQPTASKKEDLKHSGAREAKNLMEKQNSTKVRKQRQDLVAESNRLLDQDFQNTVRGMNRMLRMLMYMEQMNTKAAGTLHQANSLRYAEKSKTLAQICTIHNEVHNLNRTLISLENEAQRTYEMQANKKPVSNYQYTTPDKFYNLPYYERVQLAKSLQVVADTYAKANGMDKDSVSSVFLNSLGFNIFDEKYTKSAPTDYISFSRNVSRSEAQKIGDKNSDAPTESSMSAKGDDLTRTRVDVDFSKYTSEQIIAFRDKYYPILPSGTPKNQIEENKKIREFLNGMIFGRNLTGHHIDNLPLTSDQIVEKTNDGYLLYRKTTGKPRYNGVLHVGEDGIVKSYEFSGGTNTKLQNAKLEALEKLREEYPEVEQIRSEQTYKVIPSRTAETSSTREDFAFDSELNLQPTYTCSISPIAETPYSQATETATAETADYRVSYTSADSDSTTPNDNENDKRYTRYNSLLENTITEYDNSVKPEDLEWLHLYDTPTLSPVDTFVEKMASKSHDEVEMVCKRLEELPDKQLEERESLEESFSERTMKLVIYELKLSRTELKQQLTEEAGILSKDKSLTPTRRKQLLTLKQDEIKKKQQKRLYERLMKQKLEQRQQLAKLLSKQSQERANLAALVDSKLDHYYSLLEEAQKNKIQPIDNYSRSAMNHLLGDVSSMEERCSHLYHYYMENGNTQGARALLEIFSKLQGMKAETTQSTSTRDGNRGDSNTRPNIDPFLETSQTASSIRTDRINPSHVQLYPPTPEHLRNGKKRIPIKETKSQLYEDLTTTPERENPPAYFNDNIEIQSQIYGAGESFMDAIDKTGPVPNHYKELMFEMFFNTGNPNVVASGKRPVYTPKTPNPEQTKPGGAGPIK